MTTLLSFVRKITRVSPGGSRYVTLPKDWIRARGLEAKDAVLIQIQNDGSLRIVPVDDESVVGSEEISEAGNP